MQHRFIQLGLLVLLLAGPAFGDDFFIQFRQHDPSSNVGQVRVDSGERGYGDESERPPEARPHRYRYNYDDGVLSNPGIEDGYVRHRPRMKMIDIVRTYP
ncbi:MAG: hypothetical protein R3B54_15955 [Bdellovibrionota bacterium]